MARNQRERLMGAAVAAFSEKGYRDTSVSDLIDIAGVSRSTFYKRFTDKDECFLETLDAILDIAGERMLATHRSSTGSWDRRLETMLTALAALIAEQPAASRLALVEVYAAGEEALERLERTTDVVERVVMETLQDSPERSGLPREAVRGIIGGLRMMVLARLRDGRERELPGLVPGLLEWALSYRTPPEPLRQLDEIPPALTAVRPEASDARRRILYAITDLIAERGYADMKINDVAKRAAVSSSTIYGCFEEGKEQAFLATLEDAQERLLGATVQAYASTGDWPRAVNAASRAFIGFMATDPTTAHLGGVEVWTTGSTGFRLRAEGMAKFQMLLTKGFEEYPGVPPVAAEAIGASVDAMLFDQLRRKDAASLFEIAPIGVFLVLAPFIGSDEAAKIANER